MINLNRNDKNAYKVSGIIKDSYGNDKIKIEGLWNKICLAIDCTNKKVTKIKIKRKQFYGSISR